MMVFHIHYKALSMQRSDQEEEEERPKAKKPLGAITIAKQLSRMKEPGPVETTVLLARMIKNAFLFTPIGMSLTSSSGETGGVG